MAVVLHTASPGLLVEGNQLFFPFLNALDVTRQERMEIGVPGEAKVPVSVEPVQMNMKSTVP